MTRESIEDFREVLLPFVKKRLLAINYENRGESDAEEFERDFNEILNLAIKALKQEPKPMVEIDLYSVIKQKYIEREVLDKIRAEIASLSNANPSYWHSGDMVEREEVLDIIDKYKAESEEV